MPARNFILDRFKDEIRRRIMEEGESQNTILAWLRSEDVLVDRKTFYRRCQAWGILQQPSIYQNSRVEAIIRVCYEDTFDTDIMIAERVLHQTGVDITSRQVQRIRLQHGWRRATRNGTERLKEALKTTEKVYEELYVDGTARQWGRGFVHTNLRRQRYSARERHVRDALRVLDPIGTVERRPGPRHRRRRGGEFIVSGPDRLWCIDGHDKFRNYGIYIYAAVDAYSRKIIWLYCGNDNRRGVGVLRQLLLAAKRLRRLLKHFRSDKGTETILAADVVYSLYKRHRGEHQATQIRDCWLYGSSTANIRIENTWHLMISRQTASWMVSENSPWRANLYCSHPSYLRYVIPI